MRFAAQWRGRWAANAEASLLVGAKSTAPIYREVGIRDGIGKSRPGHFYFLLYHIWPEFSIPLAKSRKGSFAHCIATLSECPKLKT